MNEISQQVTRARRRMILGRFFRMFRWSAFAFLLIAAIAVAVPKIWHLDFGNEAILANWNLAWIGGALGVSVICTAIVAWLHGESIMQAAVEVDARFSLKERISSALTLDPATADSEVGRALIEDASNRAETIDIRDQFGFKPGWTSLLPLLPVVVLATLFFVPNAVATEVDPPKPITTINKKDVKVAVESAKKKLKKRAEDLEAKGLKDAMDGLKSIDKKIDNIAKGSTEEKKEALVQLNDIKKQVADRQNELGGAKDMKESFKKLSEVGKGPSKEIADAMKAGDFKAAKEAIKQLADKLKSGKLSETEKKKLAEDVKQLAEQLKKIAQAHEQKKQELQDKIEQAQKEGDLDKAAELQKKLEELQKKDQQQQQMKEMAEKLQDCADCMNGKPSDKGGKAGQQGNQGAQMKQAGDALDDLAEQMEDLQQQLEELQDLEDLQDDLNQIKQGVQGGECEADQEAEPKWQDWAKGRGKGGGKRESEEGDTGGFKSKVKGQLQRGETVVTGSADGANVTGSSVSEARDAIKTSMILETDPLGNQKLPRSVREHAQQYFENFRKGN